MNKHERLLRSIEQMLETSEDEGLRLRAIQIRDRLQMPMSVVLERVRGENITEKCKRIGITRAAYYDWISGKSRPSMKHAKRLSQLTGLSVIKIRGRTPRKAEQHLP
jgi:transcriptional regulator with XRE-family HTH domain